MYSIFEEVEVKGKTKGWQQTCAAQKFAASPWHLLKHETNASPNSFLFSINQSISATMAAARQAVINASVQHQLMDLVRTHQDQSKRLTALEERGERLRSAAGAILDRSTQTQTSVNETKRIILSTSQGNLPISCQSYAIGMTRRKSL
jgi:hypothetical protein